MKNFSKEYAFMKNYFAHNLKYLRKENHLSQLELANQLHVARSTVSCWENGLRLPQVESILEISKLFSIQQDIVGSDIRKSIRRQEKEIAVIEDKYGVKITIQQTRPLTKESIQEIIKILTDELNNKN